jgi:hypothetical protein
LNVFVHWDDRITRKLSGLQHHEKMNAAKTTHIAPLRRVFHPDRVVPLSVGYSFTTRSTHEN